MDRRYFEGLMADRQMSLRGLAKKMGMNHSQLSLTFSGGRRLQLDEAAQMAQLLGVTLQDVARAAGVINGAGSSGRRCQVIGEATSNGDVALYPPGVIERVGVPDGLPSDVVAIQARTADTQLSWSDGWLFYLEPPSGIAHDAISRFCLVTTTDGKSLLATVRRGYQPGTFNLAGPAYQATNVRLQTAQPILMTIH